MPFTIKKLGGLMLREMAAAWVRGEIFSELHVKPYSRELVMAIFPSAKDAMNIPSAASEIRENCGFICASLDMRDKTQSVGTTDADGRSYTYPVFNECVFIHKDQRIELQKAIDDERQRVKFMKKQSRKMPADKYKY